MIPVENMIAECEGTGTKIAVIVNLAKDVNGIAFALEKGVDAIVIKNDNDLIQACSIAKSQRLENSTLDIIQTNEALEKLTLSELTITNIQSGGTGERYCIDLICLILEGEGMLIGSSSSSMGLVHGESIESEFVPARPFRVNAGPPHSYILMANGKTKYLSELISGDNVMLVSENGSTRSATIGRLKIEKRPFLRIYWENDYQISNSIFLQQAETVRILSRVGVVKSVTELKVGDTILCHESKHSRHIGNKVAIHSREV
jgi:3-dehydroquinate synthase II